MGDGETGLNQKLKADGWQFAYAGRSVIWHRIPASRMTQDYLNKRRANQGNCDSYSTYRQTRPEEEELLNRIKSYPDLVAKALGEALFQKAIGDDAFHLGMARIHYWVARGEYDLRIIQDAKWREMVLRNDWLELAQPIHSVT